MNKVFDSGKSKWMKHGNGAACGAPGSITMEAAIALPLFLCIIIAIAFLLRAVQVHERMQHAISQAALEIAGTGYAYGLAGAQEAGTASQAAASYSGAVGIEGVAAKAAQFENWLPMGAGDEAIIQLAGASSALSDRINGALFSEYAGLVTGKYLQYGAIPLTTGGAANVPDYMAGSNVEGGANGLGFERSMYLPDGGDDVKISVRYIFNVPIPMPLFSRIAIEQEAYARAWLSGAGQGAIRRNTGHDEADIWSLHNFERGDRIQEIFHANLPKGFNVLASFKDGVATSIHSLDTTAASYQSPAGIGRRIEGYVSQLRDYQGQPAPYGSEGIVIDPGDILARRLVLVIPRNEISPEIASEIDRCIRDALGQGVILQVERYATKKVDGEKEGE